MALDQALKTFLVNANDNGYAGGNAKTWTRQADGSITISFSAGDWQMDDNFFGGEPYGGREVVFHEGKPVWMLVYYGKVDEKTDADQVYRALRTALSQMPPDAPFRGPARHEEGEFTYLNSWSGGLDHVSGVEQILQGDSPVYEASYAGGWVDRRQGV